jgi:AcrR family transcriptional regulator
MTIKEQIIKEAYKLFNKNGYENVTVMDICKACNITKPTFYRHVHSKDNILHFFYENITDKISDKMMSILAYDDYWEQICTAFTTILGWSQEFGYSLYSQLFINNLKENKDTFKFNDSLTIFMTSLFKHAQKSGQIRNTSDPRKLYLACAYMSFGYGVLWCINDGKNDLIKDFIRALEVVCDLKQEYRIKD